MPNYVTCELTAPGISETRMAQIRDFVKSGDSDHEVAFDFNKIIPMPEDLNVVSGSIETPSKRLYLRFCSPQSQYDERLGIDEETFNSIKMSQQDWEYINSYNVSRAPNYMDAQEFPGELNERYDIYKTSIFDKESGKKCSLLECGYIYFRNEILYGSPDWYSWSCSHWDTKWNACDPVFLNTKWNTKWRFETAWCAPFNVIKVLSVVFPEVEFVLEYADEDIGSNCGKVIYRNGEEIDRLEFTDQAQADEFAIRLVNDCDPEEAGYYYDPEKGRWEYNWESEEIL